MKNTTLKWLKKIILGLTIPPILLGTITAAFADSPLPQVRIKNVIIEKTVINPDDNEKLLVNYCLEAPAYVTTGIYRAEGQDSSKRIDILDDKVLKTTGCYSFTWNGKHGQESQILDRPEQVEDGTYFYAIKATSVADISQDKDYYAQWIYVDTDEKEEEDELEITDLDVDNETFDPREGEEVEFSFETNKDAYITLIIRDEDKGEVVEILDEKKIDGDEEYEVDWDGEDEEGDLVEEGTYTYKLIAKNGDEKDIKKGEIVVKYGSNVPRKQQSQVGLCGYFNDVYENYVYCEAIEWARGEGVFKGYEDGSFRPDRPISRVEALKMIFEALDFKVLDANGSQLRFSDVGKNEWYNSYLKTALSLGVINGYPDGTFKPHNAVSRVEALVMLLNGAEAKDGIILATNQAGAYLDTPYVEDTKWYYSYARFAQAYDLTDNEYFLYPAEYLTRAEMADMLYRYSQL